MKKLFQLNNHQGEMGTYFFVLSGDAVKFEI